MTSNGNFSGAAINVSSLQTSSLTFIDNTVDPGVPFTLSVFTGGLTMTRIKVDSEDSRIALGRTAVQNGQDEGAIAIGDGAGADGQGTYSIAIGKNAGYAGLAGYTQPNHSIMINATGNPLGGENQNSFYVTPIRSAATSGNLLYYNVGTKEITYGSPPLLSGRIVTDIITCEATIDELGFSTQPNVTAVCEVVADTPYIVTIKEISQNSITFRTYNGRLEGSPPEGGIPVQYIIRGT